MKTTENHPEIKTKGQLKEAAFKAACENHIWINAFSLIRPDEKTYADIGRAVVRMLQEQENLLPSYTAGESTDEIHEISRLTKMLYMSINAS